VLFRSADAFVFPSLTDTFGNVVLEALASGLAVAAFDVAAASLHIRPGVNGWLAPPDDEVAFVRALQRALVDAAPHSMLRRRAREAACQTQWRTVLQRFERQLCAVAAQARNETRRHAALA
jgi:glycosyltransferase involved in cell wall biosynthesis